MKNIPQEAIHSISEVKRTKIVQLANYIKTFIIRTARL